jgi:hypothetical protein
MKKRDRSWKADKQRQFVESAEDRELQGQFLRIEGLEGKMAVLTRALCLPFEGFLKLLDDSIGGLKQTEMAENVVWMMNVYASKRGDDQRRSRG